MRNKQKINDVLTGNELLRIESQYKTRTNSEARRTVRITYLSVLFILGVMSICWMFSAFSWSFMLMMLALITCIYILGLIYLTASILAFKGCPLILTDKGIVIPDFVANYWSEIDSFCWEEFKGFNAVGPSIFKSAKGTSLRLNLKGKYGWLLTSWTNGYGKSVLPFALIFFSPEQKTITESILRQYDKNEETID